MAAPLGFKTFLTGDVLTAADTNGYLMQGVWTFATAAARDAAVTSPQEGNMCYLKDTDVVQYYSGSTWTAVSGSPSFYGCQVTNTTDYSLANGTDTALTWNTEQFDSGGYHSTATNTSRFTIPAGKAGYYLLHGQTTWGANATGNRVNSIRKNGTQNNINVSGYGANITITGSYVLNQTWLVNAAVSDYYELYAQQSSGGTLAILAGGTFASTPPTWFSITYLGA